MTEIGLAQQRLFDDDDAQHADIREAQTDACNQPDNGSAPAESLVPLNMAVSNYDDYNHRDESLGALQPGGFVTSTSQDMALLNGRSHGHGYSNNDITGFYGDHIRHVGPQRGSSTHDLAPSSTSYNFFESSLNPPAQLNDDHQSPMRSSDTVQTETIHKTPGRSHSMQATSYSPHDTEPISSLMTPKVSRAQSDNACQYAPSQSPRSACDELAAPVAIEVPMLKKKRGRKRKQDIPEDDEDDELAPSDDQSIPKSGEPVKRKPGRPPKIVRTLNDECDAAVLTDDQPRDQPVPNTGEIQELDDNTPPPNAAPSNPRANGISHVPEEDDFQTEVANDSEVNQTEVSNDRPTDINIPLAKPSKKAKESKKKKLKRGKTTSVTLKKTYESDVEDDVIWIDERPSNHILQDDQTAQKPNNDPTVVTSDNTESFQIQIPRPHSPSATEVTEPKTSLRTSKEEPKPAPPTPKKRGRKRKKTSELQISEETSSENANELTGSRDDSQVQPPQQLDIGVSVMLERPSNQDINERKTEIINDESPSREEATPHPQSLSPSKPSAATEINAPETPKKPESTSNQADMSTCPRTKDLDKGPDKHSPIAGTSKVPYRVGLSRKARIAPLLKIIRR